MGVHLLPFLGVSVLLVIAPGPDTLLVAKNALLRGRRDGLATVAGVSLGLVIWTAAAALGIAAAIRASALAFDVLKYPAGGPALSRSSCSAPSSR